jgi:hypothetical protein
MVFVFDAGVKQKEGRKTRAKEWNKGQCDPSLLARGWQTSLQLFSSLSPCPLALFEMSGQVIVMLSPHLLTNDSSLLHLPMAILFFIAS